MRISVTLFLVAFLHCVCGVTPLFAQDCPGGKKDAFSNQSIKKHMGTYDGCFVAIDSNGKTLCRYNPKMCAERIPPFSTFKIFNSLAGLESGYVKDAEFKIKWDGTKYSTMEQWNQDHTLRTAVRDSVVWYFQKVAAGVGDTKMQSYLHACSYGSEDMSGGLTNFWLGSSLLISPDEQVAFVSRLYKEELPFSKRSMDIVKEIIRVKESERGVLSGKTGSDGKNGKLMLGWFVGYVEHKGQPTYFAVQVRGDGAYGRKARGVAEAVMHDAGLF